VLPGNILQIALPETHPSRISCVVGQHTPPRNVQEKRMSKTLWIVPALVAACGTQSDHSYQGDPLALLKGQVTTTEANPPPADAVTLVWVHLTGTEQNIMAEQAPVTGSFPAAFELELFTPPPAGAINDASVAGGEFAISFIGAIDPSKDVNDETSVWGIAEHHMLAYLPQTIDAASKIGQFLGGPTSPGYHLMAVIPGGTPSEPERLAEVPMTSDIDVRLAPIDELSLPNPCCLVGGSGGGSGT
jgi:hypothetical protein